MHAATSSATATPQETPATTRRSGTPRQRGRELNSMRILGAVALAVLLTGAAGASTGLARAAGPTVTAIDLGTLGGNFSEALDMNASGQVVGESATAALEFHAFAWTKAGGMVDLGTLGGTGSVAGAVSPSGQVVGNSRPAGDLDAHAFSWTPKGGMVDLGTLGGDFSTAVDVTPSGQVIGVSSIVPGGPFVPKHAFSWTRTGGMVDLGTLGGDMSLADAVNARGDVAGSSYTTGNAEFHATLWHT